MVQQQVDLFAIFQRRKKYSIVFCIVKKFLTSLVVQ